MTFKGTANHWHGADGRRIPVGKLTDEHLVNIFLQLRTIAQRELANDNPYANQGSPRLSNDDGTPYFNPHELELWCLENCITYPALKNQAVIRNLWDREQRIAKLPEESNQIRFILPIEAHVEVLEKKVTYLQQKLEHIEHEKCFWKDMAEDCKERLKIYERAVFEIQEAVNKYQGK